jgi:hypothetical protein
MGGRKKELVGYRLKMKYKIGVDQSNQQYIIM